MKMKVIMMFPEGLSPCQTLFEVLYLDSIHSLNSCK